MFSNSDIDIHQLIFTIFGMSPVVEGITERVPILYGKTQCVKMPICKVQYSFLKVRKHRCTLMSKLEHSTNHAAGSHPSSDVHNLMFVWSLALLPREGGAAPPPGAAVLTI